MKKVIVTTLILAVLIAGGVGWWYMFHRFDALVAEAIGKEGTAAFGTEVSVGSVKTNWAQGSMTISDLQVANPPGYESDYVVRFGTVEAAVDFESMEVARVVLEDAQFYIEERDGKTNIQDIQDELNSGISKETGTHTSGEEIVIQRFLMRGTRATFESDTLNRLSEVRIDEIEMRNLRGTGDEIAAQIAERVVNEVANEASRELLKAQAEKHLDDASEKVSSKLRELLGGDDEEEDDAKQDGVGDGG